MTFLTNFLNLRLKLLYRNFELGILFWLIPLIIFGGVLYGLTNYRDLFHSHQLKLLAANILLIILVQNKRNDLHFLKNSLTTQQLRSILLSEYSLISIPFVLLSIGSLNILHLLIVPFIIISSFTSFNISAKTKPITFFQKWNIEWNSSSRIYGLVPLFIFIVFISVFFLPTTSYFNLFIFGLVIVSFSIFQTIEEAPSFIRIFNCTPQQFIIRKIKTTLLPLLLVVGLMLPLTLIMEYKHWLLILTITAQAILYNINSILGNYANYQNEPGKLITFFIKLTFTIVPFLLPLNLILSLFLYQKSIRTLKLYLNARD